mmetsp:Transcript_97989/g.281528  ORF Transcript_97989/g.281528 Transcript_97989/m.281528 type:complete len:217 (+) Transcript_97989:728-1378(+)
MLQHSSPPTVRLRSPVQAMPSLPLPTSPPLARPQSAAPVPAGFQRRGSGDFATAHRHVHRRLHRRRPSRSLRRCAPRLLRPPRRRPPLRRCRCSARTEEAVKTAAWHLCRCPHRPHQPRLRHRHDHRSRHLRQQRNLGRRRLRLRRKTSEARARVLPHGQATWLSALRLVDRLPAAAAAADELASVAALPLQRPRQGRLPTPRPRPPGPGLCASGV